VAADFVGQLAVVVSDTLERRGQRIRLWGIDGPESDRGDDSPPYRCGAMAANRLDEFIGRPLADKWRYACATNNSRS
jgi:endonuclease YncB( thermonuclease family)